MKEEVLKIIIAEPSVIIRSGIVVALKRIPGFRIQPFEIATIDTLVNYIRVNKPDILIINPSFWGNIDISKLRDDALNSNLKCLALLHSFIDVNLLKSYDETISIYDNVEQIKEKLEKLTGTIPEMATEENTTLSIREKEIIICVVKGQTNKEIAEELFISTHTVISHRRNIARKLEIHSTAGLTIYAIVNKLIELDEIKKNMLL